MKVAICVPTYKRTRKLAVLLESLAKLRFDKVPEPDITIVVVDNDPACSAGPIVKAAAESLRFPVRYETESRKGLSFVRNRAIEAAGGVDFIAFVDDDEIVSPQWLDELLYVQQEYDADVVTGTVLPRFEVTPPPPWVVQGKFFERTGKTGDRVVFARTGNVLIRKALLDALAPPFDLRFNLAGGEDSHLFLRLHRNGAKIIWAEEAVVEEWVPRERMRLSWLLRRAFRLGITISMCERLLDRKALAVRPAKGAVKVAVGAASLLVAPVFGRLATVKALIRIASGVGNLLGLVGYVYYEYQGERA